MLAQTEQTCSLVEPQVFIAGSRLSTKLIEQLSTVFPGMISMTNEGIFSRAEYYKMDRDKINDMFSTALKRNDVKFAKQLLHSCGDKIDVDKTDEEGDTLLHTACSKGQFEAVHVLVAAGAKTNFVNSKGQTSLHISAARLQADITKYLLDSGADVMVYSKDGELPLDVASSLETALILVEKMVSLGYKELVNDYLIPLKLSKTKYEECEPLMTSAFVESLQSDCTKTQLTEESREEMKEQVGCRFRLANSDEESKERRVKEKDEEQVIEQTRRYTFPSYLGFVKQPSGSILKRSSSFTCGTSPEETDEGPEKDGRKSPNRTVTFPSDILCQMCIKENDYHDLRRLILTDKITDLDKLYANGISALHLAVIENKYKCAEVLVDSGADIEVRDPHGWTPLHAAVFAGNIRAVRTLCSKGADVCATTKNGETVFDLAVTDLIRKYLKMVTIRLVMNEKRNVNYS